MIRITENTKKPATSESTHDLENLSIRNYNKKPLKDAGKASIIY